MQERVLDNMETVGDFISNLLRLSAMKLNSLAYSVEKRTGRIHYTKYEGGYLMPFDRKITKEMLMGDLENEQNYFRMSLTNTPCVYTGMFVHSVEFDNGKIWDSYFRGFLT